MQPDEFYSRHLVSDLSIFMTAHAANIPIYLYAIANKVLGKVLTHGGCVAVPRGRPKPRTAVFLLLLECPADTVYQALTIAFVVRR